VDALRELYDTAIANPFVRAGAIVLGSFVAMVVIDFVVTRFCRVLARRTATTMDDSFIEISHRPVRITVILIGLGMALRQIELAPRAAEIILAAIQTIGILVWTGFGMRFVTLLLVQLSNLEQVNVVETRTQPLFDNMA
jgi:hypothetical protein